MVLERNGPSFSFTRLVLDPTEIPGLLTRHREKWEPPDRLERLASGLRPEYPPQACHFVAWEVIKWGRGYRFVGRFAEKNPPDRVADRLREAADLVDRQRIPEAVEHVQGLEQLGQSFASKIVRFMFPDRAVILDAVIRQKLGYREDRHGYGEFLSDCHVILKAANEELPDRALRVCDVEAAIFAKLQDY